MARILVIGSVSMDEVLDLRQPLRPGSHLDARPAESRMGGGGANTALPLAYAGHEVLLAAPLGTDTQGDWLLAQLQRAGVDTSLVVRVDGRSTHSLVLREPDGDRTVVNVHRCREEGPPERIREARVDAVYARTRELDLAPLLGEMLAASLVVAHVPPAAPGSRPAHVLVASESDLTAEELRAPFEVGRRIAGEPLRVVAITRGAAGADAFHAGGSLSAAAPRVAARDTTGAGDVFAAGLVHALVSGAPFAEALETAVAFGSAAAVGGIVRETIQALVARAAERR